MLTEIGFRFLKHIVSKCNCIVSDVARSNEPPQPYTRDQSTILPEQIANIRMKPAEPHGTALKCRDLLIEI